MFWFLGERIKERTKVDRKELMKNIQYINHPRSYLGLTRGGVEAIFSDKRRLIDIEIEIADYIESEIAKAKTSLLREIIKTIDANNLEGIDRDWFVFKLKCLEENKGDE